MYTTNTAHLNKRLSVEKDMFLKGNDPAVMRVSTGMRSSCEDKPDFLPFHIINMHDESGMQLMACHTS